MFGSGEKLYVLSVNTQFTDDKELERLYQAYIKAKCELANFVRFANCNVMPVAGIITEKGTTN